MPIPTMMVHTQGTITGTPQDLGPRESIEITKSNNPDNRYTGFQVVSGSDKASDTALFGPSHAGNNQYPFGVYEVACTPRGSERLTFVITGLASGAGSLRGGPPAGPTDGTVNVSTK